MAGARGSAKAEIRERLNSAMEDQRMYQAEADRLAKEAAKATEELTTGTKEVRETQKEIDKLNKELDKTNAKINQGEKNLTEMKEEAGQLTQQIERARPGEAIANSLESAKRSLTRFLKYAIGIRSVCILFQRLKQAIKSAVQQYAEYDRELKYNLALMSATRKAIRVQNGAALASIYNAILPIVQKIANLMLEAANAAAKFIAILSGKSTYKKVVVNTDEVAASIDEVEEEEEEATEEAKELKKQLLGFDELNILSQDNTSSKDKKDKKQKPDLDGIDVIEEAIDEFDDSKVAKLARFIRDHLEEIKTLALAVGAALGTWMLGKLIEKLTGMSIATSKLLGAAMAVGGAIVYVKGFFDAWKNGLDNGNLIEMIGGAAAVIAGLGLAAGSVGAGIGSLVTGLGLATVGFKEWADAGEMPIKTLIAIDAGIALVGFGISLLTGSWIPLAIAAIAGLMFSLPEILGGLSDFFYSLGMDNMGDWFKGMSEKAADARDWLRTNVVVPVCEYISSAFEEWNTGEHRGEYKDAASWFICGVLGLPTDEEWKQWGMNAINWLGEGFFDLTDTLHNLIGGPLENLIEVEIPETLEWFKDMGQLVFKYIKESFFPWESVLDATIGLPLRVFFSGLFGTSEDAGKDTGASFSDGVSESGDMTTPLETTIGHPVREFFRNLLGLGKDAGKDAADGMAKGIEENAALATDEAKEMATETVKAIEDGLDAHSPSKKTEEQGQNAVDGFKNAIERGTPTVVQAAHSMMEQLIREYTEGVERLKQVMNFTWSIPRPKIPKINWTIKNVSYGNGQSVSIPEFFVNWYARGGVFDFPQLIGVGDAGKEAVVPLERNTEWMDMVADGLMERFERANFANDLADAFTKLPKPAMAGGGIVPPNALAAGFSSEDMMDAVRRGVYEAMRAMGSGSGSRSSGGFVININGREFARATYDDYKAVQNEHGVSLIST